jgi:hypothetical protein
MTTTAAAAAAAAAAAVAAVAAETAERGRGPDARSIGAGNRSRRLRNCLPRILSANFNSETLPRGNNSPHTLSRDSHGETGRGGERIYHSASRPRRLFRLSPSPAPSKSVRLTSLFFLDLLNLHVSPREERPLISDNAYIACMRAR